MDIHERIKDLRENLGKTQEAFAKDINISRSNLGNIETGKVKVTDRVVRDIAERFNVREKWLRSGDGEPFETTKQDVINKVAQTYELDELSKSIMEKYLNLTNTQRNEIDKYIKAILEQAKSENG